jgi:hypothetical protein
MILLRTSVSNHGRKGLGFNVTLRRLLEVDRLAGFLLKSGTCPRSARIPVSPRPRCLAKFPPKPM